VKEIFTIQIIFFVEEDFFASFENSDLLLDNELDDHCV
jgi:hypothetical protein